jgi:hypothetical protein
MSKLTYAIKDSKLTHISEVERGLECNCVCPKCGAKVLARKGNIKVHHFSHYDVDECEGAYETSLHLLAKEILTEAGHLRVPSVIVRNITFNDQILYNSQDIQFDSVEVEKNLFNFTPDILIQAYGVKLIIEIRVTHKVDDIKREKIVLSNISTIEVDLSDISREITKEILSPIIIDKVEKKKWLYNRHIREYEGWIYKIATKLPVISRKFACHVDNCPIYARTFNKKPYANLIEDCFDCEFLVNHEVDDYVFCLGKYKTTDYEQLKKALKNNDLTRNPLTRIH